MMATATSVAVDEASRIRLGWPYRSALQVLNAPAAGMAGLIPATDLVWLERLRGEQEALAAKLDAALASVRRCTDGLPDQVRAEHEAAHEEWRAALYAAALDGQPPPAMTTAALNPEWLEARVYAAELAVVDPVVLELADFVGRLLAALREHGDELDAAIDTTGLDEFRLEGSDHRALVQAASLWSLRMHAATYAQQVGDFAAARPWATASPPPKASALATEREAC